MPHRMRLNEGNRKWWTLAAMCFALFMIMLDNTVVNVALPSIQKDLHASISGLEWTINGYTLSFAVLLATGGRLGDIFGRRRMFLAGAAGFTLMSLLCAVAPGPVWLVVFRVLQGLAGAVLIPQGLGLIKAAFPPEQLGAAFGAFGPVNGQVLRRRKNGRRPPPEDEEADAGAGRLMMRSPQQERNRILHRRGRGGGRRGARHGRASAT